MIDENGIYILPDSHFKPPYETDDTSIWNQLAQSPCQSIITIKKASRFYKEPMAYAKFIAMRYVYSGETQMNTLNSSFILHQNDVCLLNSGFTFSQYLSHDEDIVFTLMFEKDYLLRNVLKDTKVNSVITRFILDYIMDNKNPQNYILFHGNDNDRIQNIMENLLCEYIEPGDYSEALIESYIRIFLLEIFCCDFEYSKTPESRQSLHIAKILDYIDKNFNTVTLDILALKFGYNSKYLSRLIKNYTGKNFKDLILEKRMERASLLLLNTDLTIHMIMEDCGLSNETYFYRCFHKKYNMTPNEYRSRGLS
jgi:AraC-like DNA-binding protein